MPCYYPIRGYRSKTVNTSGKRNIVFTLNQGYRDMPVEVPCGQCIGCRLERSRQWAIRCVHESQLHEQNAFLTLTYNDQNLPKNNTLVKKHFQDFMKRYRFKYAHIPIRYYMCGEYGELNQRPHYHAIIFGHDFNDKKHEKNSGEQKLYTSEKLDTLWGLGHAWIGDVTFESAAYVARYIMKKMTGDKALHHYNEINKETGEILSERIPEYTNMSRRPGVGKDWFEKYKTDVYPDDFVVLRGKMLKPPKYYNSQYELGHPDEYETIKLLRKKNAKKHSDNNTHDRLMVREEVQLSKLNQLKRNL